MPGVIFDTSSLVHFVDQTKPFHAAAWEYYQACLTQHIPIFMSAIVAGEFEVKQPISDLPLQNFEMLAYEIPHAVKAAHLFRVNQNYARGRRDTRRIIINDLKIIAQAADERIRIIITEDKNTLARYVDRFQRNHIIDVFALLLSDGCAPHG